MGWRCTFDLLKRVYWRRRCRCCCSYYRISVVGRLLWRLSGWVGGGRAKHDTEERLYGRRAVLDVRCPLPGTIDSDDDMTTALLCTNMNVRFLGV